MFDRRKPAAPAPFVTHENIEAKIKWFDPEKGFGFASPSDGAGDVFVHVSAIGPLDAQDLQPGATIIADLGEGRRGLQVVAVHEIDASTATPAAPRGGARRSRRAPRAMISAVAMAVVAAATIVAAVAAMIAAAMAAAAVTTVAAPVAMTVARARRWRGPSTVP